MAGSRYQGRWIDPEAYLNLAELKIPHWLFMDECVSWTRDAGAARFRMGQHLAWRSATYGVPRTGESTQR